MSDWDTLGSPWKGHLCYNAQSYPVVPYIPFSQVALLYGKREKRGALWMTLMLLSASQDQPGPLVALQQGLPGVMLGDLEAPPLPPLPTQGMLLGTNG